MCPRPSPADPASPQKALVTLAIGKPAYAARTLPLLARWARREHWDLVVLEEQKLRFNPNWPRRRFGLHIEKYQLFEYLGRYDRVIYADADILVHPDAPNLFSLVPEEAVGGVWDDTGPDFWKREEALARVAAHHGAGPLPERTGPRFLNAGLLVLSRAHRELWRFDRQAFVRGRWPDQTLFNYRLLRTETPIFPLPETCNLMPLHAEDWTQAERRRQGPLVHYASREAKEILAADLPFFERAWGEWEDSNDACARD